MKLTIKYTNEGVQFERTQKDGKIIVVANEQFIAPMESDKALDSLRHEVSQRGNVTRASLTFLVQILQHPRVSGYIGQGDINSEGSIPKEVKGALRSAEELFFAPMFKDNKKLDLFLTSIRDAGIYATAKGVALKYFWFAGKLPCVYEGDKPQTDKLLSVSAMQKLLSNMQEEKQPEDKSIARQVLELQAKFEETSADLKTDQLKAILSNLKQFAAEVTEAINTIASEHTDLLPQVMPMSALDQAIAAQWAENEHEEEETV